MFRFYKGKKVLVTGHTGFKGTWLCGMLLTAGAEVTGYALKPPTDPSLFELCGMKDQINSVTGDIRDLAQLRRVFDETKPEIVFHLAAQPLVRVSYKNPVDTYGTNVMGTVHVLECVRQTPSVRSVVNVTTDKVYKNMEWERGYVETDVLNGYDPYSNSKSCSELVTSSYINSFFQGEGVPRVSTARAGNVIGGGDFAPDRIIPDCVRAVLGGQTIIVRNPNSIRPYQYVLEPLKVYLMIAERQWEDRTYAGNYNVGPEDADCLATGKLVELFCGEWKEQTGEVPAVCCREDGGPHEANFLKLDCSRLKETFGWHPRYTAKQAVEKVVEWTKVYKERGDIAECMRRQVGDFI